MLNDSYHRTDMEIQSNSNEPFDVMHTFQVFLHGRYTRTKNTVKSKIFEVNIEYQIKSNKLAIFSGNINKTVC